MTTNTNLIDCNCIHVNTLYYKIFLFCQRYYAVANGMYSKLRRAQDIRCFCPVSRERHDRSEETKVTLAC